MMVNMIDAMKRKITGISGKKADVNWYMIGAVIFAVMIIIILLILRKQSGGQEGILSAIFKVKP
ncbi:MAG: hypothetical protein V1729_01835 [Candidatus Woesearchaeota archaeon]